MPKKRKSSTDWEAIARDLLQKAVYPRGALPYTEEFERLKQWYTTRAKVEIDDAEFWALLDRVGKRGGLAKKGRQGPSAPRLTPEQELEIVRLMPDGIGRRDRLPYTAEFDRMHRQFSRLTKTRFTKYEFWRAVSRVAKKSRKPKPLFDTAPLGELPSATVETLERLNPWWRAEPDLPTARYRRWAFKEAWHRLQGQLTPVVAIRGPRRVGKTTIQNQIIEQLLRLEGVSPARILRVQFDDVPQLGSLQDPILAIVRWFEKNVLQKTINRSAEEGEPVYLFFDEIQNLKNWAPELKLLVDHTSVRTLVTGSSSLRILQGRDSLAGRLSVIELGPLRLSEIAGVRGLGELVQVDDATTLANWTNRDFWLDAASRAKRRPAVLKKAFSHFCRVGGYPDCHKLANADRDELAERVVDVVVERTIEHDQTVDPKGRTWDRNLLRETFRQICRYAGQSVKPARICDEMNTLLQANYSPKKVTDAIQFLTDAMLVHRVEPMEALLRRRPNGTKYCLCDHFIREAWLQERIPLSPEELNDAPETVSTLAGHIVESVLGYYLKGISGLEVSWFPQRGDEPEVDYVLTIGLKRIPVEIKYKRGRPKRSDLRGLERFCSRPHYNAPFGLLITRELTACLGESVIALPASTLLSIV